ncbi:MAG: Flagellar biosynthesis protein FlhF [Firmicutes bacterium]|nr:Flagellar biosynthesis protein FlhF [Bacillota bacterium]MDI6704688.1 flagellar biosynthesis protein FlhF [Bacillota bacterium]
MKVKRYVGPSVEEALNRVREEMGTDAVILNKRRIKPGSGLAKMFSRSVYEIIAAVDEYEKGSRAISNKPEKSYQVLEEKVDSLKLSLENIINKMHPQDSQKGIPDLLAPYYRIMVENDVAEEIARAIIEEVASKINLNTTYDQEYIYYKFKQEISSKVDSIRTIELSEGRPSIAVFVGPTGVGKTTTLAKLTAQYALAMKKNVGVITCDTYRIAAVEQLKTYCEIMGVPVKVVYQQKDIVEAMDEYRNMDLVLVDTAGRSHRDKMRILELQNLLKNLGPQQVFLVISATTNFKNCLDILENYSFLEDYRIIITKIDENVTNGILLNLAVKARKPLSYLTTGQNVPDDIEKVSGERVASLVLSR